MADVTNMSQDELNAHNKLVAEALRLAKQEARYRKEVSASLKDYLAGLEKSNNLKKTIRNNEKIQSKFEKELADAIAKGNAQDTLNAQVKLDLLKKQNKELEKQQKALDEALATVNKSSMVTAKLGAEALKGIAKLATSIPGLITKGYGQIKGTGLFDMDKAIRQSGQQMGLLSKQTGDYRNTIKAAAWEASKVGVTIEDLTQMQSAYSDELGRTVLLTQQESVAMAQVSADAQISAEAFGRLTAEMDAQGLSALKTSEFVNKTMNDAHKMGLNASKVVKSIAGSIKLLNRYNFKNGVDGLAKMAQTVAKLGVSMEFAAGFADKLFDVEGAVDMSAQLQVMGGEWAKLADPFSLMYKARNDIQGLTEDLGKAAAASAHLNKKGEIEISAMEMHKLKIIAQQTGIAYNELAEAGKRAFKLTKIQGQVQFQMSDEEKEFLANQAKLDENGKAYIYVKGDKKFISQMGIGAKEIINAQMKEEANMGERAKNAQTFDDALTNTINGMKTYLLPLVTTINDNLLPKLEAFGKRFEQGKWGEKIGKFAEIVGELVSTVGGFIIDNPIGSAIAFLTTKLASFFLDKATWISNGLLLAQGFNAGASLNGSSSSGMTGLGGKFGKGLTAVGGGSLGRGAALAGGAGLAGTGLSMLTDATTDPGSGWNIAGKAGAGALQGAALGALLGPIGAGVGALIGGLAGGITAAYATEGTNDGIFTSPLHDGRIPAIGKNLGSDFSKNRGIIQGGKITPIDNKDDLMAMKRGGPVDKVLKQGNDSGPTRIEFSTITIQGEILLKSPGNPGLTEDLMKDPQFKRDITRTIQVELEKNKVGGKNKG